MDENEQELKSKKANYYLEEQKAVHIILENGRFFNGVIKSVGTDFLLIDDRKLGETCVFFIELKNIEPFTEVRE